ncbi:MAG: ABC transporter ATP-binding protein [Granulosicoccus sp.]
MAQVKLSNIVKRYGAVQVVYGIDLDIAHNEFVVLVGPSGCGKSTTLRMIAGLEELSGGDIHIGDNLVNELPPRDRNISMVFQNYALYPHMTVGENLGFSLKIANKSESEIKEAVDQAAQILSLGELLDRRPAELSGGQRQRVAMGRAIVRHPDVFLFDEPLSNLDAKLRAQMRVEIKKLHQRIATTIIYVTHDQVEAMTLADRIVIMRDGRIEQQGTPLEVFEQPVNTFVATFIGSPPMNLLPARLCADAQNIILADDTSIPLPSRLRARVDANQSVVFGFRADNLMPDGHGLSLGDETAEFKLTVNLSEPLGTETVLFGEIAGQEIQAKMLNPRPVVMGESLACQLDLSRAHLFDAGTQKSLG